MECNECGRTYPTDKMVNGVICDYCNELEEQEDMVGFEGTLSRLDNIKI